MPIKTAELYQLAYCSNSTAEMGPEVLDAILRSSEKNNSRNEVSGILLYHDNVFFQVLEGEEDRVKTLFQTIGRDPRHNAVSMMWEGQVQQRSFPDWAMGYAGPDEVSGLPEDVLVSLHQLRDFPSSTREVDQIALALTRSVYATFERWNGSGATQSP